MAVVRALVASPRSGDVKGQGVLFVQVHPAGSRRGAPRGSDQMVLLASVDTLLEVFGVVATTPKYHVPLARLLIV